MPVKYHLTLGPSMLLNQLKNEYHLPAVAGVE